MESTQKYTMDNKQIMITYDLIDAVKSSESSVTWSDMVHIMERLDNEIINDSTLGHVINKDGKDIFIELYFEIEEKNSYIVDHYELIDSDRFLDLMLAKRRVNLANKAVRSII